MSNGMTSREAAALYLSEGQTTDPGLASLLDNAKKQPELLIPRGSIPMKNYKPAEIVIEDPEEQERIRLAKLIGFDVDITINDKTNWATLIDKQYKYLVKTKLTDDTDKNAEKLSKAMMRLKIKHDRRVND